MNNFINRLIRSHIHGVSLNIQTLILQFPGFCFHLILPPPRHDHIVSMLSCKSFASSKTNTLIRSGDESNSLDMGGHIDPTGKMLKLRGRR